MLTTRLEKLWEAASIEKRVRAETEARIILEHLVHYPKKHGRYYTDDVQKLAAELLFWATHPWTVQS